MPPFCLFWQVKIHVMDRFIDYSNKLSSIAKGIADIIMNKPVVGDNYEECCVGNARMKMDEHLRMMVCT